MRPVIRALGWAINLFWIIVLFFAATVAYSAFQTKPGFAQPYTGASSNAITISIPFSIDNRGFYDISNLNLTTLISDNNDLRVSESSTFWPVIRSGTDVSITHNMSVSFDKIAVDKLSYLLFNDSNLNVDVGLKLNYANAVPLKIHSNTIMRWGAPLAKLAIGTISISAYNATHARISVPVSFENHSFLELNGTINLEIVDSANKIVGGGSSNFSAPRQNRCDITINVLVSGNPANVREARLFFETSAFSYGPVVIPIV
jgi:hypothetical protein